MLLRREEGHVCNEASIEKNDTRAIVNTSTVSRSSNVRMDAETKKYCELNDTSINQYAKRRVARKGRGHKIRAIVECRLGAIGTKLRYNYNGDTDLGRGRGRVRY